MIDSLKKVYYLLPPHDNYKLAILLLMMLVSSFNTLAGIGMVPVFVTLIIDSEWVLSQPVIGPFLDSFGIQTPQRLVVFGAALLILLFSFKNLYIVFYEYLRMKYMLNRHLILQNRLFNAYMRSGYTFFLSRNSSELLRNVSAEVGRVIDGTLKPFLIILLNAITTLVIVVGLMYVEPLITITGMILFGSVSYLYLKVTKNKIRQYGRESLSYRQFMTKAILQGLGGFKDAKVLNREKHFLDSYHQNAFKHKKYDLWKGVLNVLPVHMIELMALTGILFIATIMVLQYRDMNSIITVLALFGAAITKLKPSVNNIILNVNSLRYNIYSVEAIYDDLVMLESKKVPLRQLYTDIAPLTIKQKIEIKNVEYTYPDANEPAIRNINITIPKNCAVAFVGASGVGKTTLVDLILGLLEPQKGTVEADGVNIFDHVRSWQKNIGYIPQFIFLTDDTIRNNICFGIPEKDIDENKVWDAVKTAQLAHFVNKLDDGLDTIVGERGVRLSGGQRQRIGIARAVYNNPQILIMDEATSALDNITERHVVNSIEKLRGDKTIIMIAHRLTTVQRCDTIYMMKDAEIIAEGSYEQLLLNSPDFREMSLVDS